MEDNKKTKNVIYNVISAICGAAVSFATTFGIVNSEKAAEIKAKLSGINTKAVTVVTQIKAGEVKKALAVAEEIVIDTKEVVKEGKELTKETKEKVSSVKVKDEVSKVVKATASYK